MGRARRDSIEDGPPLRLRIPASLAVVVVGAAATLALSVAACEVTTPMPPPELDAGQLSKLGDGGLDSTLGDGNGQADDAGSLDASVAPDTPQGR